MKHQKLSFLRKPQKTLFFTETLCTHIKYSDIHVGFLFRIFELFEMCISTMDAYAPRSQRQLPVLSYHFIIIKTKLPFTCSLSERDARRVDGACSW